MFRDFINLVVPDLCPACRRVLVRNERIICTACLYALPRTRYASYTDNPVARLFWGRVYLENATALFQYHKGSRYQQLIHEMKYKGRQDIGREMGRQKENVVPIPSLLSTQILPPCSSMKRLLMDSPRPVPP